MGVFKTIRDAIRQLINHVSFSLSHRLRSLITQTHAIAVDALSHSYTTGNSSTQILSDVSFFVERGETVALIGRSGSGKSTLLNLISGLEPIISGEVRVNGQALSTINDSERTRLRGAEIGFIYQAFNLIPTLSVEDNVALPLALSNVSYKHQQPKIADALQAVGLQTRARDYPDQLSGGEQQRVAIARALIHRPALILADEPTGNLDAQSGRLVLELLSKLVDEQSSSLLLVTHSQEVAAVADKILLLEQGGISSLSKQDLSSSAAW